MQSQTLFTVCKNVNSFKSYDGFCKAPYTQITYTPGPRADIYNKSVLCHGMGRYRDSDLLAPFLYNFANQLSQKIFGVRGCLTTCFEDNHLSHGIGYVRTSKTHHKPNCEMLNTIFSFKSAILKRP